MLYSCESLQLCPMNPVLDRVARCGSLRRPSSTFLLLRAATGGDAAVFGEWSRCVLLESSAPAAGGLGGGGPGGGGGSGGGGPAPSSTI